MDATVHDAEQAIAAIEQAGERLALACKVEMELEDERPLSAADCIREMIGTTNPLGKEGAVHSASSAKDVVESHSRYAAHRRRQTQAVVEKQRAQADYAAAKLRARLSVELLASVLE